MLSKPPQEFADIVVRCNDGGELKAHRAVLGIASPVFRCMLNSPMKEGAPLSGCGSGATPSVMFVV